MAIARIADSAAQRVLILDNRHDLADDQKSSVFYAYALSFADKQGVLEDDGSEETAVVPETVIETAAQDEAGNELTVEEAVYEMLNEEQQLEYVDAAIDRELWWTEIVGTLAADAVVDSSDSVAREPDEYAEDTSTAAAKPTPDDDTGSNPEPETHPGSNLFDMMR